MERCSKYKHNGREYNLNKTNITKVITIKTIFISVILFQLISIGQISGILISILGTKIRIFCKKHFVKFCEISNRQIQKILILFGLRSAILRKYGMNFTENYQIYIQKLDLTDSTLVDQNVNFLKNQSYFQKMPKSAFFQWLCDLAFCKI